MLNKVRDFLNKSPWLGWALAAIMLGLAVFIYMRRDASADPYSPERMREEVTIRFTDTNDEITMTRGRLDQELRRRGNVLDPSKGVINPKTGQPTGFPFDKADWESLCARINQEKSAMNAEGRRPVAPAAREVVIPPDAAKILEGAGQAPPANPPANPK